MMFLYEGSELTGFLLKTTVIHLDSFDYWIINPAILLITRFINAFQFVQNGRDQAYVIHGIVFILLIFIGPVLNLWH